jgi:DNA-binding XRE family transcriptional regulator
MTNYFEAWQCRAARGALDWTADHLAKVSGVSRNSIVDFEASKRKMQSAKLAAIVGAFEAAGISFGVGGCVCRLADTDSKRQL